MVPGAAQEPAWTEKPKTVCEYVQVRPVRPKLGITVNYKLWALQSGACY